MRYKKMPFFVSSSSRRALLKAVLLLNLLLSILSTSAQNCFKGACPASSSTKKGVPQKMNSILTAVYNAPDDMAAQNFFYGNGAMPDANADCARVASITRDEASGEFIVKITLNIDGRGCNTTLPWTVAPRRDGQSVIGSDALTKCDAGSGGCTRIDSGPRGGLTVSFAPPVYRAPLTMPQNSLSDKPVPFGYTGYHVYETESKGQCGEYGFTQLESQAQSGIRRGGLLNIAMARPRDNECNGHVPQQSAFTSIYTPKQATNRLAHWKFFQRGGTNFTILVSNNAVLLTNQTLIEESVISKPYGYLNLEKTLGITQPFLCSDTGSNSTNSTYKVGSLASEAHSCPMTITEWEAVLQDVAMPGVSVDEFFGPNTTAYTTFQRDGAWIVPSDNLGTLPMVCYRCSRTRGYTAQGGNRALNYASRHFPISMSFGPQCAGLTVQNSRQSTRVAVGGFVGLSATEDANDGRWLYSAGFPVRYAKSIGTTERQSSVTAPGPVPGAQLDAKLGWTSGTGGIALRVDMSNLRYVLCNGGGAAVMPAGVNTTTGQRIGPLVSKLIENITEAQMDLGPAWPNPFRWLSLENMEECAGCTYPTVATQKGWTVMDSQIWTYGQHNGIGGYHMDHSVWSRILALVNGTEGLFENGTYDILAAWNSTGSLTNRFANAAKSLSQKQQSALLQGLSSIGIPGIGVAGWMSAACDETGHMGRPTPRSADTSASQGLVATPFCWLLRRQLYSQSQARLSNVYGQASGAGDNLIDLSSAERVGIFNPRAPNVWFGVWHRRPETGDSQWQVFMGDTWDRTGGSIFGEKGIADDVVGEMEIRVPIASVETIEGPDYFTIDGNGENCGIIGGTDSLTTQTFSSEMTFSSASPSVLALTVSYVPQNCKGSITYDTESVIVETVPDSSISADVSFGEADPVSSQQPLKITVPYDTVGINVTYTIGFKFLCGIALDAGTNYGFSINTTYLQYNSPASIFVNKLGSTPTIPCSRSVANQSEFIAGIQTYYMEALAPPIKDLPLASVCVPVYLDNPMKAGLIVIGRENKSAAFEEEAKNFVQWNCLKYKQLGASARQFSACNVSGDGSRVGECEEYETLYAPGCQEWWDLSCNPYSSGQLMFIYALIVSMPAILMSLVWIGFAIQNVKNKPKRDASIKLQCEQMKEHTSDFERRLISNGSVQDTFRRLANY